MTDKKPAKKEAWIEPETTEMDVAKFTMNQPGVGSDGSIFADCTLS
jgi:hypothetical protein